MDEQAVRAPGPTYRSAPSLVTDLTWVLWIALKSEWRDHHPLASELLGRRDDLVERIRSFWGEDGPGICFTEAQILAHHAGALGETSPTELWAALERAIPTVPTDLALESESPEDRAFFLHRLERLKASPALVSSYLELLSEVWGLVDEIWQAARPDLEELGRRVVGQLESGQGLAEVFGSACETFTTWLPSINARLEAGRPLLVIPCLFFGKSLYLEFPGLTVVGSGFRRDDAAARARTEALARRLKTVADPTRLALLHYLATTPSTVGDLAASFGLAQPTVSMHMKSLRGSGLVRSERKGGRVQLSADPGAVETLLEELRSIVVQPGALSAKG
jgi:ArsR family transcriptional regulator, arsenate/arsenite/antimonite-responsive transcriptional repressor